jgi:hypothetical protein
VNPALRAALRAQQERRSRDDGDGGAGEASADDSRCFGADGVRSNDCGFAVMARVNGRNCSTGIVVMNRQPAVVLAED